MNKICSKTTYSQNFNFSSPSCKCLWYIDVAKRCGKSCKSPFSMILVNGYGSIPIHTIFRGMNIHLPAILMFTRGIGFWPIPPKSSRNQPVPNLFTNRTSSTNGRWSVACFCVVRWTGSPPNHWAAKCVLTTGWPIGPLGVFVGNSCNQ